MLTISILHTENAELNLSGVSQPQLAILESNSSLCRTWKRKSMYLAASFNVCILLNLSEGKVGMIFRSDANAWFRDCVLCLSRPLAMTLCVWGSSGDWGLGLDLFPLFPGVGLSESSPSVRLDLLLFLPPLLGCLSTSPSLLPRLSTGEPGELQLDSRVSSDITSDNDQPMTWNQRVSTPGSFSLCPAESIQMTTDESKSFLIIENFREFLKSAWSKEL